MEDLLSIWLMPAPPLAADLAAHIGRIAGVLGSPPFPPHLTLLGDVRVVRATAVHALAAVAHSTPPLSLIAREITTAPARFTAVTVRFQHSDHFDRLAAALRAKLGLPPAPPPDPHLSLAYPLSPIEANTVRSLVVGVPLRMSYAFDAFSVVDPGPDHADWEDVEAWRVSPPTTLTPTLGEA